jgi:mono/diheme cytochrome c family protein
MPRERPRPAHFEPEWLDRSLDRYMFAGLVFMMILVAGFVAYRLREPTLRRDALAEQTTNSIIIGRATFASSCQGCHGPNATGGSAPTLNSKEFLSATSDDQIDSLITSGVSGTEMSAWGLEYGGTLTDQQVRQIVAYLRSLQPKAPSVPDWRKGHVGS